MDIKDSGECFSISSGPSGNEEKDAAVPVLIHLIIQPLNAYVLSAHCVPGKHSYKQTRPGPSVPLTTSGDPGPQEHTGVSDGSSE